MSADDRDSPLITVRAGTPRARPVGTAAASGRVRTRLPYVGLTRSAEDRRFPDYGRDRRVLRPRSLAGYRRSACGSGLVGWSSHGGALGTGCLYEQLVEH